MTTCVQDFEPLFRRLAKDYEIRNFTYPEDLSLSERKAVYGYRPLPVTDEFYRCMSPGYMDCTYLADANDLLAFTRKWPKTELVESGLTRLIRELLVLTDDSAMGEMGSLSDALAYTFRDLDYEYHGDEENGYYYSNRATEHIDEVFAYKEGDHLREFDTYMESQ